MGSRSVLRDLWSFLSPHPRLLGGVAVGLVIDEVFVTALPLSLKFLIDHAIEPADRELLIKTLIALVGGVVLAAGAMIWRDYLYARLGSAVMQSIRRRQFEHMQTLPLEFFERTRAGDLTARFSTDLAAVETVVVGALPGAVASGLGLFLAGIALVMLDLRLAAIALLSLPIALIGPRFILPRAAARGVEARRLDAEVLDAVQENLASQATIKALGMESQAIARVGARLERFSRANRYFNFFSYVAERTPNITILLFHVVILAVGAYLCFEQKMTVGTLVAFNALLLNLSGAVGSLTSNVPAMLSASAGMHRIGELLREPASAERPGELRSLEQAIKIEDVGLVRGEKKILDGVTLEIQRGWSVALVGTSGCGKSTILRLLAAFTDPTRGRITFDGVDLASVSRSSLRKRLGVVLQDTHLFDGSVRDNIRCARPEATDEEIERALDAAEADFARKLPLGLDTQIGPGGPRLSGGQRQRLAIARAFVRQPDLFLLDEATSALDPATERKLNETFAQMRGRHTLISVTHRLGDAHRYDRIFVFDAGELIEQGSHETLSAANGTYAKMARRQEGVTVSDNLEDAAVSGYSLSQWPLFEGTNPWLLEEMTREFVTERFGAGEQVIEQGMSGDRCFIIARGTVSVRRGEEEIAKLHDGDAFGEAALLSNAPRNASVFTLTDCVFLSLERTRFRRWLDRDATLKSRIEELSER